MKNPKTRRTIIALAIIVSAMGYLLFTAAKANWAFYCSVDELMANIDSPKYADSVIRLAGKVSPDNLIQSNDPIKLEFDLQSGGSSIRVIHNGVAPLNFEPEKEVIAQGRLNDDKTFLADVVMTRCESKYESKLER